MRTIEQEGLDPYIGPRPFGRSTEDRGRFFGRDRETEDIVTLIYSHQLVLVFAQSGAGKTSIFNAGVVPELEKNGFEALPTARVGLSPTALDANISDTLDIINLYIFNAISSMKPDIDPKILSNKSLLTFLNTYFPPKPASDGSRSPQVIMFDQLEELFSILPETWQEQQKLFFKQVAEVLDTSPFLRIVFIIREDYLGELEPFAGILPEKLRTRFRLERLRRNAALSAVKGPLKNIKSLLGKTW